MNLFGKLKLGKKQALAMDDAFSVLFVCMGNICRSPTAEAVFRTKAQLSGLSVKIDSAGTIGHHAGHRPDQRSVAAGESRGYDFSRIRSRKVTIEDFYQFDLILAMDRSNYQDLLELQPSDSKAKVELMLTYATDIDEIDVPDPYYGGGRGFEHVLDLLENACDGLAKRVKLAD